MRLWVFCILLPFLFLGSQSASVRRYLHSSEYPDVFFSNDNLTKVTPDVIEPKRKPVFTASVEVVFEKLLESTLAHLTNFIWKNVAVGFLILAIFACQSLTCFINCCSSGDISDLPSTAFGVENVAQSIPNVDETPKGRFFFGSCRENVHQADNHSDKEPDVGESYPVRYENSSRMDDDDDKEIYDNETVDEIKKTFDEIIDESYAGLNTCTNSDEEKRDFLKTIDEGDENSKDIHYWNHNKEEYIHNYIYKESHMFNPEFPQCLTTAV